MSCGIEGGQVILVLRLATLSRTWDTAFHQSLAQRPLPTLPTKHYLPLTAYPKAA